MEASTCRSRSRAAADKEGAESLSSGSSSAVLAEKDPGGAFSRSSLLYFRAIDRADRSPRPWPAPGLLEWGRSCSPERLTGWKRAFSTPMYRYWPRMWMATRSQRSTPSGIFLLASMAFSSRLVSRAHRSASGTGRWGGSSTRTEARMSSSRHRLRKSVRMIFTTGWMV